jgi:hypothetical protein
MPDGDRRRILDLLAAGNISVEQAEALLAALGSTTRAGTPLPPPPPAPGGQARPGRRVRTLQIQIDSPNENGKEGKNVSVNIPIGLARLASRFLPQEARVQLDEQGVDLKELIESLSDDLPDGPLLEIDAGEGEKLARITIRAV